VTKLNRYKFKNMFGKSIEEGKKDSQIENLEGDERKKLPQDILEEVENNSVEEEKVLKEIELRVGESDPDFQKEENKGGFVSGLAEKIKKNKFLRASLVAYSLCSASEAFTKEIPKLLEGSQDSAGKQIESNESGFDLHSKLEQFNAIPEEYKKQLEQVFSEASGEKKKIIQQALDGEVSLTEKEIIDSKEDVDLLKIQQQIIDLQNSGEMASRKRGGVILPFDSEHSGKTTGVEFSDDTIAENEGRQRITIENASENQIRAWIDSLKNQKN
jgi:hypothetical protein